MPNSPKENRVLEPIEETNFSAIFSGLEISCNSLNSLNINNRTMPNAEQSNIPVFESKLLQIVPQFDGNPLELSSFLDTSNTLINQYWDPNPQRVNCVQNITVIYGIYSKLVGKAREVYSICIAKDWHSVKSALVAHFGDQRDENGLLFDLDQLRQHLNEPSLQFYTRVMSNLSALHNYVDIHENLVQNRTVKKTFYNTHALKIFLAGLREPLGSTIRAMKPCTLAEARQYIIAENNIRHLQKPHNFENNNQIKHKFKPQQSSNFNTSLLRQNSDFPRSYFPQQVPNFQQVPSFHQAPNFQQQYSFPRGPIHIQPRPVPQQRFFTNSEVFGRQQPQKPLSNVWKPRPNFRQQTPTPMSGVSTIRPGSMLSHASTSSQYPTVINKQRNPYELHNLEQETTYYPDVYTEYPDNYGYPYEQEIQDDTAHFEESIHYETDTQDNGEASSNTENFQVATPPENNT